MMSYFTKKNILLLIALFLTLIYTVFSGNTPNKALKTEKSDNNPVKNHSNNTDYLFVFSWSPTYCLEIDPQGKQTQCRTDIPKQYRFIVHGLWPQLPDNTTQGKYLNYCRFVNKNLDAKIVEKYFYLMPSSELMHHEWIKHGSCGDFTQHSYFEKIQDLYQKFHVADIFKNLKTPKSLSLDALITDLTTQIPNISRHNIVVYCRKNYLGEVRICLNADYSVRKCRLNEVKSGGCRASGTITVPLRVTETENAPRNIMGMVKPQ